MSPINDSFMSGSLDHSVRIWDLRVNTCQIGPFPSAAMWLQHGTISKYEYRGNIYPRWPVLEMEICMPGASTGGMRYDFLVMAWSGVKVRLLHGGIGALGVAGFAEVEEV
ncbi:hypothetical protein ACLB2K_044208 [Fragaria x ananassa]